MGFLKAIFAFAGGPAAWFGLAVDWFYDALAWCARNWKLCLAVLVVLGAAYGGVRYERAGWEERWAARDAREKAYEDERIGTVLALEAENARIEEKAARDKAARDKAYKKLEERLKSYVAERPMELPPPSVGDACRAVDIGDDGVQLIRAAIAARGAGADQGQ